MIFAAEEQEITLPLARDSQALPEKIQAYIEEYNLGARQRFEAARLVDEAHPERRPNAGKSPNQREIRRDPDVPGKLQTRNPNKPGEGWETGPKLGKFLQEHYQWALHDALQRETLSSSPAEDSLAHDTRLRAIAHHREAPGDALFGRTYSMS